MLRTFPSPHREQMVGWHVLMVGGDADSIETVREALTCDSEAKLKLAGTLETALQYLQREEVDVVLLDLILPGGVGWDAFSRMQRAAPHVPFIVLGERDDDSPAAAAVKDGAQDWLNKDDLIPAVLSRSIRYAVERVSIITALSEERKFARALIDAIPDRMYIKDRDSRFLQINRQTADVLDLKDPMDALGKTDFDYFRHDHAQEAFEEEEKIVRSGEPLIGKVEKEVTLSGRGTWLITTKMPRRDATGKIVGIFGISRDISEIKSAEEALRNSEERYRGLLESVMDYHYTVLIGEGPPATTLHGDGCLTVTGYARDEYAKDPGLWARMIHPKDLSRVVEKLDRLLESGEAEAVEHRIIHKDGSVRWIRNTPTPQFDAHGKLASYDGVVVDISERKQAELQLMSANTRLRELVGELTESHRALQEAQLDLVDAVKMRSLGQLAAGIAHEVKNPLGILLMGVNCLAEPCATIPEAQDILQEMETAINRANKIITELLEFSSAKKLELSECDLNAIIRQSLEYVRHTLIQGKVMVVQELGEGLPSVLADSAKLEQVLINLLTNACHAMPGGGTLTVRTSLRTLRPHEVGRECSDRSGLLLDAGEEVLAVDVEDTGTGIPEDKLSQVFDPFFSTKPVGKGTGLGLAVTRNIIELHGGRIEISNREGGGAAVALTLRRGADLSPAS